MWHFHFRQFFVVHMLEEIEKVGTTYCSIWFISDLHKRSKLVKVLAHNYCLPHKTNFYSRFQYKWYKFKIIISVKLSFSTLTTVLYRNSQDMTGNDEETILWNVVRLLTIEDGSSSVCSNTRHISALLYSNYKVVL